jgi:hypothetical protein
MPQACRLAKAGVRGRRYGYGKCAALKSNEAPERLQLQLHPWRSVLAMAVIWYYCMVRYGDSPRAIRRFWNNGFLRYRRCVS